MALSDPSGFKTLPQAEAEVPWYRMPQNLDKGLLLQETRIFSETPLQMPRCRALLTKLAYLLVCRPSSGGDLTRAEATGLFFALTKLFQSSDLVLRRMVYFLMKELLGRADDVIIIISSLTKDMTKPVPEFRSNATRLLARVVDGQMMGQLDRFMRAGVVDKEPCVSSATLVSGVHLMSVCPEVVRRWASEVREASTSKNGLVQYHALGLLHAMQRSDRHALTKMLTSSVYAGVRQPLVQLALIRIAKQVLCEEKSPEK